MNAQSRTYNDFFEFLGSKPHKLFSRPEEKIEVIKEVIKGLTKTEENEKDNSKTTKPNVQNKKKHDILFVIQNTSHPKYIKQKQKSNNILKNKKKQNKTKCIPSTLTFIYI